MQPPVIIGIDPQIKTAEPPCLTLTVYRIRKGLLHVEITRGSPFVLQIRKRYESACSSMKYMKQEIYISIVSIPQAV